MEFNEEIIRRMFAYDQLWLQIGDGATNLSKINNFEH